MITQTLKIFPLSGNKAWQGKRFKTPLYKKYEKECLLMLKKQKLPEPPYTIIYEFGFSNNASDIDNPTKPFTDILSKKFGFNDKHVKRMILEKVIVPKGKEYVKFSILTYEAVH